MNAIRARVLIVDYDEEILIKLERLLENEGFATTTAWPGRDAFKALYCKTFDLVLLSEYLPAMDAEDFVQRLQRAAGGVPCVVMQTGRSLMPDLRSFSWPNVVNVVCKWSPENVLAAVRTHHLRR
jgi:DNA-binding response OmpR family regulator